MRVVQSGSRKGSEQHYSSVERLDERQSEPSEMSTLANRERRQVGDIHCERLSRSRLDQQFIDVANSRTPLHQHRYELSHSHCTDCAV